ncbi:MAG: redoxin domain-containing protein [Candidatus Eremiobacteraeota bacterium]|nr:redoxin domain-containing protein [Candidatus Eremiobacteraeota bacterium]
MSRYVLWAILTIALAIGFFILKPFFAAPANRGAGPGALVGEPAPVFALKDDRGIAVSLDRYRGRVVLMNLWASWCPPCRAEMPDLQHLQSAYAGSGLAVLGVNEGESAQRAHAFADSLQIRFPIWIDAGQQYGRAYAVLGLPTTVILDRHGVVVRGLDGALTFRQMESAVSPLVRAH